MQWREDGRENGNGKREKRKKEKRREILMERRRQCHNARTTMRE